MTRDLLVELQSTHDYLRTIQRDLSAFPPDLAALDANRRALERRVEEGRRIRESLEAQAAKVQAEVARAKALEDQARTALKAVTQKAHYAAAIREVEDRERARNQAARPLRELEARLAAVVADLAQAEPQLAAATARFDEVHAVFLSEHETQVVARDQLEVKRAELEGRLTPPQLAHFRKLLANRAGKAVVAVESGACSGCHTKLRTPFLARLRDTREALACESCQRFVVLA
jgi:hypothetical protein